MIESQSAWAVIAKDPELILWGSHDGYDDEINEYYTYDSQVGNYRNVQVGDLVFVKGSEHLLGFGQIESIISEPGEKVLRKCPKCGGSPEMRTVKSPKWRCTRGCKYEFSDAELVFETIDVIKFKASYRNTWTDANFPLAKANVFEFQSNRDTQSAIRPLELSRVPELIMALAGSSDLPMGSISEIPDLIIGGHRIQIGKRRIGQQEFRLSLIGFHGEKCFISGAQPACVLEASHIRKFADHESHAVDGGLLLRRDFHTLFDRYLLRINPETWKVETAPQIHKYPTYGSIHLQQLEIETQRRPSADLLAEHFEKSKLIFAA